MKKIILLLFAFGLTVASKAQNYPLAKDGTTWQYVHTDLGGYSIYNLVVDGDTTANGNTYKKVYSYSTRQYDRSKALFEYAFRETGDRIYALPNGRNSEYLPEENKEVLLYDYSLQEGDQVETKWRTYTVDKVDYVEIDGKQHKRISFAYDDTWLEGVGSLERPFGYPLVLLANNGEATSLELVEQDGKMIYGSPRFNLLADGVHWTERTSTHGDVDESGKENFELQHFSVSGDSVINGVTYKKVFVNGYPYMNLREDENRNIFYYNRELEKEGLLYNFESKGRHQSGIHYTDETGKDCIIVKGQDLIPNTLTLLGHRYIYFPINESSYQHEKYPRSEKTYLIHGVGLTQGIFQHIFTADIDCICYNDLVSLYNGNDELVYQNPDFTEDGEFTSGIVPIRAGKLLTVTVQNGKATFTQAEVPDGSHPTLSVYNTNGSLVLSRTMETETLTLNFPAGTYLYRLERDGENIEAGKFVTGK